MSGRHARSMNSDFLARRGSFVYLRDQVPRMILLQANATVGLLNTAIMIEATIRGSE